VLHNLEWAGPGHPLPVSRGVLAQARETGQVVVVQDVETQADFGARVSVRLLGLPSLSGAWSSPGSGLLPRGRERLRHCLRRPQRSRRNGPYQWGRIATPGRFALLYVVSLGREACCSTPGGTRYVKISATMRKE